MALAPPLWGIVFSLLLPLSRGLGFVVLIDALNSRIEGSYRATINSLISLVSRAIFIATGSLIGFGVDSLGVRGAIVALLMLVSPVLIFVTLKLLKHIERERSSMNMPVR